MIRVKYGFREAAVEVELFCEALKLQGASQNDGKLKQRYRVRVIHGSMI